MGPLRPGLGPVRRPVHDVHAADLHRPGRPGRGGPEDLRLHQAEASLLRAPPQGHRQAGEAPPRPHARPPPEDRPPGRVHADRRRRGAAGAQRHPVLRVPRRVPGRRDRAHILQPCAPPPAHSSPRALPGARPPPRCSPRPALLSAPA
eukprot:2394024-Prymnesium_polylepis.1